MKSQIMFALLIAAIAAVVIYFNNPNRDHEVENQKPIVNNIDGTEIKVKEIKDASNKYLEINGMYPENGVGAEIVESKVRTAIDEFKNENDFSQMTDTELENLGFKDGRKYTLNIAYKTYHNSKLITHRLDLYTETGGAHGSNTIETYTFNANGELVGINDLFNSPQIAINTISQKVKNSLMENESYKEGLTKDWLEQGAGAKSENFNSFAIDGENLIILFQQYQIAPYVYGNIEQKISLSDLANLLKPEYKQ